MKRNIIIGTIAALVLVIGVVIAAISLGPIIRNNSEDDLTVKEPPKLTQDNDEKEPTTDLSHGEVVDYTQLFHIESMSIKAKEMKGGSVLPNSAYEIKLVGDVSEVQLRQHLKVSVDESYKISKKSEGVYELTFDQALEPGKVVSMVFDRVDNPYGFAFQTELAYGVTSVYPADQSVSVAENTLIEIAFSKDVDDTIAEYIEIEPGIEGTVEIYDRLYRFIPSHKLNLGATVTLSLKEGYSYKGETMLPFTSEFKVKDYDYNTTGFNFSSNGIEYALPDGPIILEGYGREVEDGDELDLDIYPLQSTEEFLSYENLNVKEVLAKLDEREKVTSQAIMQAINYDYGLVLSERLPLGYYYVALNKGENQSGQLLHVSHYNAYAMADLEKVLVWVQNNGGLSNVCKVDFGQGLVANTGQDGLLVKDLIMEQNSKRILTIDTDEEDPIILQLNTTSYQENISYNYWQFLETDRPVYLPSDEVVVSGYIASKSGEEISEVTLKLVNDDLVVEEITLPISTQGDYLASFSFEEIYSYGMRVEVYVDGEEVNATYFGIEQFEKPTFTIDLTTDKEIVEDGGQLTISGEAKYYGGTPLAGAELYIRPGWRLDIGSGERSQKVYGDENGRFKLEVIPYYETTSWEPRNVMISASLDQIDSYYNEESLFMGIVPRDMMVEIDTQESQDGFVSKIDLSEIVFENIENVYDDPETYKGEAVAGKSVHVTILDHYYSTVSLGQKYDPITKKFYEDYDYIWEEVILESKDYISDDQGQIIVTYNQVEENHSYNINLVTLDNSDRLIEDGASYGRVSRASDNGNGGPSPYLMTDQYDYEQGQTIEVDLYEKGVINDRVNDQTLYISVDKGIDETHIVDGTYGELKYPEELVTGIEIYAIYYDGSSIQRGWGFNQSVTLSDEERKLNVEITTNKASYSPGESVSGEIKVTRADGKPASGFVDIKVVDEAYYTLYEDSNYDPLRLLLRHNYNYPVLGRAYASSSAEGMFGGAEGGEGGEGYLRSEFDNTAFTGHLNLDDNGLASFNYELPGNLTQWRMTVGAIDPDIYGGYEIKKIDATLPFHVSLLSTDTYHVEDEIGLTLKVDAADSDAMSLQGEKPIVDYTISFEKDGQSVSEQLLSARLGDYTYVPVGSLELGDYKVKISAKSGVYSDGISRDIHVVETKQHFELVSKNELSKDTTFPSNNQVVELSFMNDEAWRRYTSLSSVGNEYGEHDVYKVAKYVSHQYLKSLGIDNDAYASQSGRVNEFPYVYPDADGLFRPIYSSETSVITTVDIIELGWLDYLDQEEKRSVIEGLRVIVNRQEGTVEELAASLYGLALLEEPVLLKVQEAMAMDLYKEDVSGGLYIAKALTTLGDYNNALTLLSSMSLYSESDDTDLLDLAYLTDKSLALLMTIYGDLNMASRSQMIYDYLDTLSRVTSEPVVAQMYDYLTHLPTNILSKSFSIAYGEHKEVISLDYNDIHHITLSPQELESLEFDQVDKGIMVINKSIGSYRDVDESEAVTLSTQIYGQGSKVIGDIVTVGHNIEVDNGLRSFVIHEVLPSGMAYVNLEVMVVGDVDVFTYTRSNGKNSTHYCYVSAKDQGQLPESYSVELSYSMRASAVGKYVYEPVVLQSFGDYTLAVGDERYVTITKE